METAFTPLASLGGGLLIGTAAVLLMAVHGRIFGATGILSGLLSTRITQDWGIRASLLIGMMAAPLALLLLTGKGPVVQIPIGNLAIVLGGVLVGIGVSYGGGCTSGHGVCGNARFSRRSMIATLVFMAGAFLSVFITRHVLGGF
ncbi:YeeE/YedE family protein [Pseudooceanicola sp. CBS1P-1]|uniref:YeeE/YedE family protein n=1 Tax=Pseudooceanicola albus TaxID=2692189 RepID=A0A6L7G3F5_9RHOB|nr:MULTISPECIES: YeeE/YedE family protein [Pseudooceanicola]MBT9384979.1 YeeE/YedE family protein [Pseudooceanicola endophyticus]MXN18027.1 YeeE/YedE family protein [Pseudooceanicola albus]